MKLHGQKETPKSRQRDAGDLGVPLSSPARTDARTKVEGEAHTEARGEDRADDPRPKQSVTQAPLVYSAANATHAYENTTRSSIPNGTAGVTSTIAIPDSIAIAPGSTVAVKLAGAGNNRLEISLVHNGSTTVIHPRVAKSEKNLALTFPLDVLKGSDASGSWSLNIVDDGQGKSALVKWSLHIAEAAPPAKVRLLSDLNPEQLTRLGALLPKFTTPAILKMHEAWHVKNGSGGTKGPGSGELFLRAHEGMLQDVEKFLTKNGSADLVPLPVWLPNTDIPSQLPDPNPTTNPRLTSNPHIDIPSWLTVKGGAATDPLTHGYTKLGDFKTLDELGLALACSPGSGQPSFHASGHVGIGGTMNTFGSPADPIFWEWHALVDSFRQEWAQTDNGKKFFTDHPEKLKPLPMGPMHMGGMMDMPGMRGAGMPMKDADPIDVAIERVSKDNPKALKELMATPMFNDDGSEHDFAHVRRQLTALDAAARTHAP